MDNIIVGIDLGTTNSLIAIWKNKKLEIITDEYGNRTIPSIVSFQDGNRLIGIDAKNNIINNPKNTIYNVKRYIGQSYDDEIVQHDLKRFSYNTEKDKKDSNVSIKLTDNTRYTPEEISSIILMKLKLMASKYLDVPITRAVITIPAYFNDSQRQATKDAAKIAGLQVVRLLNEPTAAALAYGLYTRHNQNIIVFDLGGGTLDVSLLNIEDGIFQVVAISGNSHLGGEDFDQRIVNYCINYFQKKNGINYLSNITFENIQKLKKVCEQAKRILTNNETTNICIDNFYNGINLYVPLSRQKFNEICNDLFLLCLKYVQQVLDDSKLTVKNIDEIILVGGSSRMVQIQDLLKTMFNGKELNRSVNPDEVVVAGAALQAYRICYPDDPFSENIVLLDVTPLTLGIETLGKIMTPIIKRNSAIPIKRTRKFTTDTDYQDSILIRVFEGERHLTKDNYLVGSFELTGIDKVPSGVLEIEITYQIDINGIVTIKAYEKKSGNLKEIQICGNKNRLSDDEIDRLINEARIYELNDKIFRDKLELEFSIKELCMSIKQNIQNINMNKTDIDNIISYVNNVLEKLGNDKNISNDELEKIKLHLQTNYSALIYKSKKDNIEPNEKEDNFNGTQIYGNDDNDDINDDIPDDDLLKQIKNSLEELCLSLLDILTSTSTNFNISDQDKYEFKDFLDKNLLWLHVKNNTSIEEHQKKIDLINEYTNEIMQKYNSTDIITDNLNDIDILKRELEELCFSIKYTLLSDKIISNKNNIEKQIDETLEWINNMDMKVYMNNLKINVLKDDCNDDDTYKNLTDDEKNDEIQSFIDSNNDICIQYQNKINEINKLYNNNNNNNNNNNQNNNNQNNNNNMGTKINNKNKIDERIADLLLEINIQSKLNII
jgi:heat shock protein 1/8